MTCLASVTLTTGDLRALAEGNDIPGLLEDDGYFRCELRGSHPGRHVTLVDHLAWDEDPPVTTHWLWWDSSSHHLTHAPSCLNCHLPHNHPADSGCGASASLCTAATTITDADRSMLEDLEDAVHQAETDHRCQYTAGHEGPHIRLAQSQDRPDNTSTAWWVSWPIPDGTPYRLAIMPECPATAADSNDDGLCLHPSGHPGDHCW
ncbi:hypothetical protein [Streptomyces sp. V3I7]|uniref:hypothetical protein n=1 Tax=Streptomyces sp. V3I7 TaxID=3042278 RepID=UPI002781B1A2|nr:hypothetical protein [Streptomyces sp. V3I7]MDQ0988786.1 hypothetical protein [Streptomyces sp. V3I7]